MSVANNRLAIIDKDTGEIVEDHLILIGKKPFRLDRGYVKVFVAFLYDLVENDRVAGKAIRLLMYMLSKLDYDSYEINIIPQQAIEDLKVTRVTFYEWMNILIDENIIEKVNRYKYRLKPYCAVRGQTVKADKKVARSRKPKGGDHEVGKAS